jgi:hypothetical protein
LRARLRAENGWQWTSPRRAQRREHDQSLSQPPKPNERISTIVTACASFVLLATYFFWHSTELVPLARCSPTSGTILLRCCPFPFQKLCSCPGPNRQTSKALLFSRAMTDEWNERLRCPKCGKSGTASLSQSEDADIPTVHSVPDGFTVVAREHGPDFHCTTCNVAVVP